MANVEETETKVEKATVPVDKSEDLARAVQPDTATTSVAVAPAEAIDDASVAEDSCADFSNMEPSAVEISETETSQGSSVCIEISQLIVKLMKPFLVEMKSEKNFF